MNDPARHYRCDVRDFVSDLMSFIKEQIGRAIDDPLDQFAATVAASGVVPVMRERLVPKNEARLVPEDVVLWGELALLLTPYLDRSDGDELASLGKRSRDDFVTEAARLIERINDTQNILLA
jgi:hypothetical protein